MYDSYFFCRMLFHIFYKQSPVTLFRCFFTTQETSPIKLLDSIAFDNIPLLHG